MPLLFLVEGSVGPAQGFGWLRLLSSFSSIDSSLASSRVLWLVSARVTASQGFGFVPRKGSVCHAQGFGLSRTRGEIRSVSSSDPPLPPPILPISL